MKYMLVLQFPEEKYGDLDWIAYIEESIDPLLSEGFVDGHDIGSGTVNIFIHSNNPEKCLNVAKMILEEKADAIKDMKAAYREMENEHFICLWPIDLKDFDLMYLQQAPALPD